MYKDVMDMRISRLNKIIGVLIVLMLFYLLIPKTSNTNLQKIESESTFQELRVGETFYKNTAESKYLLSVDLYHQFYDQDIYRVYGKDELKSISVNGQVVYRYGELEDNTNYESPSKAEVDFSKHLTEGKNQLEFELVSRGYEVGISIRNTFSDVRFFAFLLLVSFVGISYIGSLRINNLYRRLIYYSIYFSSLLRFVYLTYTPYWVREHDFMGHIEHYRYWVENFTFPSPSQCFECFQPPVYYLLASIIDNIAGLIRVDAIYLNQLFNLLLSIVFVFVVYKIFDLLLKSEKQKLLSMIPILFLPSIIMHSVRIGNDQLTYLLFALFFYEMIKWIKFNTNTSFSRAVVIISIAIATKLTSILLIPMLFFAIFLKKEYSVKFHLANIKYYLFIVLGGFVNMYSSIFGESAYGWISDDSSGKLNHILFVPRELINFIFFNPILFINEPYMDPWGDSTGREYLLQFFFKSILFGEFHIFLPFSQVLARGLSILFLMMLPIVFIGIFMKIKKIDVKSFMAEYFLYFAGIVLFLILFIYRYQLPVSSAVDFRNVLAIIIPISLALSEGLMVIERKYSTHLVNGLTILFVALSSIFILTPLFSTY